MPKVEIIYVDRNKDSEEYECSAIEDFDTRLILYNVTHPFVAKSCSINMNMIDYYIEYEEEE